MRTRKLLVLDALVFAAYLFSTYPKVTGYSLHEWVSLGFAVVAVVHLAFHGEWLVRFVSNIRARLATASGLNVAIDAVMALAALTVMVSGFAVSRVLASAVGITAAGGEVWSRVHSVSADLLMVAVVVHLALHARWIAKAVHLVVVRPLGRDGYGFEQVVAALIPVGALATVVLFGGLGLSNLVASEATVTTDGVSSTSTVQTCPATGCTASSCHAETGASPYAGTDYGTGTTSGSTGTGTSVLTCPATGCTASSCHATSGGGHGHGARGELFGS